MEATQSETGIAAERMVNEVIRTHPAAVAVFNRFGIDSCCGGACSIGEATVRDGADHHALLAALSEVVGRAPCRTPKLREARRPKFLLRLLRTSNYPSGA